MVQYLEKYKKNIAIDMRKRGMSYSEIEHKLHIPKSTLSSWLKDVELSLEHRARLEKKRRETAITNAQKKKIKALEMIEEIKSLSSRDVRSITKRELWLLGIILYWRERLVSENINDIKRGINFTTSDPYLIKLFIKWLKEAGNIPAEEIQFDIFLNRDRENKLDEAIKYWQEVTGFQKSCFERVYYQKTVRNKKGKNRRKRATQTEYGLLRIRVKGSTMLVRQIAGWIRGIIRQL